MESERLTEDKLRKSTITPIIAGGMIGRYLREVGRLRPEWIEKKLTDEQVGRIIFYSDRNGELYLFFTLYDEACQYYEAKSREAKRKMGT
jgi:hypothetical protein